MALLSREEQAVVWDYFKPRHTHAWNMLVLSWSQLDQLDNNETELGFETEYHWENFILRLWLYRTTVKTLTRLQTVEGDAKSAINEFDNVFSLNGRNQLKGNRADPARDNIAKASIRSFSEQSTRLPSGVGSSYQRRSSGACCPVPLFGI